MASIDDAHPPAFRVRATERVDATIVVYLRIVAGIAIFFWAKSFLDNDLYSVLFQQPRFLFKYAGLEWVKLWPGDGIYWHFVITMIAGVCLTLGLLTRISAALLCLSITYVLLVECSIYVNHYYLLACVAGLFVFLPADRCCSIDRKIRFARGQRTIPRWQLWLLRFQLGIPYVFGAVAKLNHDWFDGQPSGIILSRNADLPGLGPWLTLPGLDHLMSYGGFFYDLLIVPMLLWRRTRWLGLLLSLIFHLTNAKLLNIGVFPWFMLATLLVFFPVDTVPRIYGWFVGASKTPSVGDHQSSDELAPTNRFARIGMALASLYVGIQLLLPVRPWILPGNASWNERGQRFSWRMMLRDKVTLVHFLIVDSENGEYLFLPSHTVITPNQILTAQRNPELIRQAAVELANLARELGTENCRIYCLALVSLNGRRPEPMIDPTVDLLTVKRGLIHDDWVTPSPGRLSGKSWAIEPEQWWRHVVLPEPFKPLQGRTPTELREFLKALEETSLRQREKPHSE